MTKLTIGKETEREPEVRFWLEYLNGGIRIMARMDGEEQIIAGIRADGYVRAFHIFTPELIKFFGNGRPFAGLA